MAKVLGEADIPKYLPVMRLRSMDIQGFDGFVCVSLCLVWRYVLSFHIIIFEYIIN